MSPSSPLHQMKSIGSDKLENQSPDHQNQSDLTDYDFKIVDTSENLTQNKEIAVGEARHFLKQCKICHLTTYLQENKQICRNCHEIKGAILDFGKPQPDVHERQEIPTAEPGNVENDFNCSICNLNLGTSQLLSAHIDKNHEDHKCKICDQVFLAKELKLKHDSIVHNGSRNY